MPGNACHALTKSDRVTLILRAKGSEVLPGTHSAFVSKDLGSLLSWARGRMLVPTGGLDVATLSASQLSSLLPLKLCMPT